MNISLIIPHRKSVTGNLVTARRLAQGLKTRGHRVFLNGAEEELATGAGNRHCPLIQRSSNG